MIRIKNLNNLEKLNLGYIIISSETSLHYSQYLKVQNIKNVKILIEKPVFDFLPDKIKLKKNVFVGYNLRFNPVIQYLKNFLSKNNAFLLQIECGYYLPFWRSKRSYAKTYSAIKKKGGGVLNDLSHEIDYVLWFLKKLNLIQSYKKKISNLKINSEDISIINCSSKKVKLITFNLNYLNRTLTRNIKVETKNCTLICDIIKNEILIFSNNKKRKKISWPKDARYLKTYDKMHSDILNSRKGSLATLIDGINVLKFIKNL